MNLNDNKTHNEQKLTEGIIIVQKSFRSAQLLSVMTMAQIIVSTVFLTDQSEILEQHELTLAFRHLVIHPMLLNLTPSHFPVHFPPKL